MSVLKHSSPKAPHIHILQKVLYPVPAYLSSHLYLPSTLLLLPFSPTSPSHVSHAGADFKSDRARLFPFLTPTSPSQSPPTSPPSSPSPTLQQGLMLMGVKVLHLVPAYLMPPPPVKVRIVGHRYFEKSNMQSTHHSYMDTHLLSPMH